MEVNKQSKFLQLLKLLGFYAKLDLMWLLRDTKIAIFAILSESIAALASISSIFLLAMRFKGIGNMSHYEVLFMLGYVTSVFGVFNTFCSMNNVGHISRRIGRGQFEHMFIQPLAMPIQLISEGFIPFTGSSTLVVGISITCIALNKLAVCVTWWWVLSFVGSLLVSLIIILSLSYLFSSTAFYAPVACEEISMLLIDNLSSLTKYPLTGMPKFIVFPLITILPYGLLGWFPSMT